MSRIRGKDTAPERTVLSLLKSFGYRPDAHRRDLPGIPDLVLPRRRIALFVHGCFWHRHPRCKYCYSPKTNTKFWNAKFQSNVARDRLVKRQLRKRGWRTLIIWECELRLMPRLKSRLRLALARRGTPSR